MGDAARGLQGPSWRVSRHHATQVLERILVQAWGQQTLLPQGLMKDNGRASLAQGDSRRVIVGPPLLIVLAIVENCFLIQNPANVLGVLYCGKFFCRKQRWEKYGQTTWQTSRAKKQPTKSWPTLGNCFLEMVPKPSNLR